MGVFTFFKLYKWYQIAQRIANNDNKFVFFFTEPFELTNTARAVYDLGKFVRIKEEFKRVCINI